MKTLSKLRHLVGALTFCATISVAQATPYHMQSAWNTGNYQNLFVYYGVMADDYAARNRLLEQYNQFFKGGTDQTVMYAADTDKSYIKDINSNDIRSEGMSYGMMIAVQMGDQDTFDRLWRFTKTYMQNSDKSLAWRLSASSPYSKQDTNSAPDGEEYMAMALYFAKNRRDWYGWPDTGIDYAAEGKAILDLLRTKLFDPTYKQVLLTAAGDSANWITDPSYHLPAFYQLWQSLDPDNATFWADAATQSRTLQWNGAHATTGLFSEYSTYRPGPMPVSTTEGAMTAALAQAAGIAEPQRSSAPYYFSDAYRVMGNIGMDFAWFTGSCVIIPNENPCPVAARLERDIAGKQLTFFAGRTDLNNSYMSAYSLDGTPRGGMDYQYKSAGHLAMNAVAALAVDPPTPTAKRFVQALWDQNMPSGQYRYYDGMLHMLAMLHVSGRFRIYAPLSAGAIKIDNTTSNQMQLSYTMLNTDQSTQSNLRAYYYFTVENGRTPVVDDINTPNVSGFNLENLGSNQWAIRINYSGVTLNPGQAVSQADVFRIRYSDWSTFSSSNDFSAPIGTESQSADRIAVFNNASKLIMGSKPKNVSNPAPIPYTIRVRARGTTGQEVVNLTVGGTVVATWQLSTSFNNYSVNTTLAGGINVVFTNNSGTRDVVVDYADIGGVVHQAEQQTNNTAAYGNGRCGGGQLTEWMHCNGYLGFSAYR
jgi:endo-1,4-beta-D-glucanase Y